MRVIIEKIVSLLFQQEFPTSARLALADKIQRLKSAGLFPPFISIYLDTLRLTGNIGAHEAAGTKEDVEAVLPIFLRIVEWFLDREFAKHRNMA